MTARLRLLTARALLWFAWAKAKKAARERKTQICVDLHEHPQQNDKFSRNDIVHAIRGACYCVTASCCL